MTNVLHLPARADAPIACDMRTATDTPEERLAEYHRLFEHALVGRERRDDSVVLSFRADPDTRDAVTSLVEREAACCPFLDYRVEAHGDELRWTTTGASRPGVDVILDALYALPDHAGSDFAGYLDRLADDGVHVEAQSEGFALRTPADPLP